MNNINYNEETETVKNIFDYIKNNSQEQRQSHIDLNSKCIPYYLTMNSKYRKVGDLASNRTSMFISKENLLKFLKISNFKGNKIHTCHLCKNDSASTNFVCVNPLHLYFGTASENHHDKDPEIIKEVGSKGGKTSIANGKHSTKTISICPYCQKSGQTRAMKRWHFDNCKHNTQNIIKAS